jgi:hypothetical protein
VGSAETAAHSAEGEGIRQTARRDAVRSN